MITEVKVLEELTWVAPFGVRFWDVAAMAPADLGITVVAYPNAIPELRSTAAINHTGVYFFHGLPGMRQVENGDGNEEFWAANPPSMPFTVEVSDPQDRYVPYQFSVLLPAQGLYGLAGSPHLSSFTPDATWLPLFASPSRILPGPSGVVRAQLQDDAAKAPAAWALVIAQAGSLTVAALADDRGVVTVTIPYPEPTTSPFASPLGPGSLKLSDQTWPLTISVFYTPPISSPVLSQESELAALERILSQRPAAVWRDTAHSGPAAEFTLQFGKELVLRSVDSGTGRDLPVLLITPA